MSECIGKLGPILERVFSPSRSLMRMSDNWNPGSSGVLLDRRKLRLEAEAVELLLLRVDAAVCDDRRCFGGSSYRFHRQQFGGRPKRVLVGTYRLMKDRSRLYAVVCPRCSLLFAAREPEAASVPPNAFIERRSLVPSGVDFAFTSSSGFVLVWF